MQKRTTKWFTTYRIVIVGVFAALAFVSNFIRFPFLGSQITAANAVCVLNGLLFGPLAGFLSSGIGAMLYDIFAGYGVECLITFVSKGAISLVCGLIAGGLAYAPKLHGREIARLIIGCVVGALTYVVLYMLKTFIMGLTVYGLGMAGTLVKMGSKLPASLINALFASVATPLLFVALHPSLKHVGYLEQ